MPIVASDIRWHRSTTSGSAGNTLTQPSAAASLGKYISTTEAPAGLHGLFAQLSAEDNAGLVAQWVCIFIRNAHATLTLGDARVYLSGGDPAGGAAVAIALDTTAASPIGSSSAQALTAASLTAPGSSVTGLAYSTPTSPESGLVLGNLPPGQCRAIWVRRTGANQSATTEQVTLAVRGTTLA